MSRPGLEGVGGGVNNCHFVLMSFFVEYVLSRSFICHTNYAVCLQFSIWVTICISVIHLLSER